MPYYDFWRNKQVTGTGRKLNTLAAVFVYEKIYKLAPKIKRVIEIGPGRGAFANICWEQGLSYTAVDFNVALLRDLAHDNRVCSFVPPLPLRDAVADVSIASHVLEHASSLPQAQTMLSEMRRIVQPGGYVVIISPDLMWVRNYFWNCDYSHNFPISARRAYQLFLDTELKVVQIQYVYNHLNGLRGWLVGSLLGRLPYCFPGAQPDSPLYADRAYKLRMTFSRSVLVVGQRPLETR